MALVKNRNRWRIFALAMILPVFATAQNTKTVDRVVVDKSDRELRLLAGEDVIERYPIQLGREPIGHKLEEGDSRTPEGRYFLDARNPNSEFFLSIHVSYPNTSDRQQAAGRGVSPGGQIMIHGQPNEPRYSARFYETEDWTDGCIAVSNAAMIDIWLLTGHNTPVDIVP